MNGAPLNTAQGTNFITYPIIEMATKDNEQRPNSFVFYRSFFDAIEQASEAEQLQLYRGITLYALNGQEPEFKGLLQAVWLVIRPQIEANYKRYLNGCKGAEHGKKGGRPKQPQAQENKTPPQPQENPTLTPNDNYNVNDNENYNDNEDKVGKSHKSKRAPRFVAPTLQEIKNYIVENSLSSDADNEAEKVFDYYTSKGWKEGNAPMKDWKAAIRNWCRKKFASSYPIPAQQPPTIITPKNSNADFSERF